MEHDEIAPDDMSEATKAITDRDWWNEAKLPGWKLHGWTDRHQASFFREDGSWGEMHMTGELATEIIRLRDLHSLRFIPAIATKTVRFTALQEVLDLVKGYEATAYQHGHLPVDPHECAAQVAREIVGSILALINRSEQE